MSDILSPPLLAAIGKRRIDFWAEDGRAKYGDCDPFAMLPLVRGKDVLEIGPGEGRQRKLLAPVAGSYTACDICVRKDTWLMKHGYATDFGHLYDLVFFWCVLHHVLADERLGFAWFVLRHLKPGGFLWFNAPEKGDTDDGIGDGIGTTGHPHEAVLGMFPCCELLSRSPDGSYLMRRGA